MLNADHRQQGLEFGGHYGKWTSTEWQQIAFSAESRFKFRRTDGRWHVRRETDDSQHPATIAGRDQVGGGSFMVWECFLNILWVQSSLWKARWINKSTHSCGVRGDTGRVYRSPLATKLTRLKPNRESVGPSQSDCSRHGSSPA
ncbi:transposable element Tcb1 transposase [Trichonephila clavipes]|nr:transposable element Tcb1 transposase [Trichonephila clavipes]